MAATKSRPEQHTKPEVFIIESLDADDELNQRYEGRLLAQLLIMSGKRPKYYYFESKAELPHLVGLFRQSRYRYLHLSMHGNARKVYTKEDSLTYKALAEYFSGELKLRRLFASACEVGNAAFCNAFADSNKGMHSIVAPMEEVYFHEAAALWCAFYVSMFSNNKTAMKRQQIADKLQALTKLFPITFFMAAYDAKNDKWKHHTIK